MGIFPQGIFRMNASIILQNSNSFFEMHFKNELKMNFINAFKIHLKTGKTSHIVPFLSKPSTLFSGQALTQTL
jgi:hypothetical protein